MSPIFIMKFEFMYLFFIYKFKALTLSNKFIEKWNVFLILICQGKRFLIAETLRDFDFNHWKATLDTKTLSFLPSSFVTNLFPFDVLQFWKHYFKWNSWQTAYFCIELIFIVILTYHDPLRKKISREGRIGFGKHKKKGN